MPSRSLRLTVLAVTIPLFTAVVLFMDPAAPHAAVPARTGDLWEVTSQMSMEGMPMQMPAQKHTVCAPKNWTEPPGAKAPQQDCSISDVRWTDNKMAWKMSCASPKMTGEGELTRTTPSAYDGAITMTGDEGTVTIRLSGKLTGECDYQDTAMSPSRSQAASQKLDADLQKMQADGCKGLAQSLQLRVISTPGTGCDADAMKEIFCDTVFSPDGTKSLIERGDAIPGETFQDSLEFCADANGKAAYCSQFDTPAGFSLFAGQGAGPGTPQETIATFCGLSLAQVEEDRQALCKAAAAGTSDLAFLARFCPAEAKSVAERECAGRSFTSMGPSPYAQFCATYATTQMDKTAQESDTPQDDSKLKKTKKFLKKVFPH